MARKNMIAGLVAAGVLGLGVAAPAVAFAADGDTATPSPSASASASEEKEKGGDRTERRTAFAEALANELGVSVDEVTAALEKLHEEHKADRPERGDRPEHRGEGQHRGEGKHKGDRPGDPAERQAALKERLAEAVEEGKLTQEQAEAITAAVEAGVFGGPEGRSGR